jgi:hypothetical protein
MRLLALLAFALVMESATAQHGASASNMALLGHEELQARSAYQPVIHTREPRQADRGYVYIVDRANTGMHILQLQR